MASSSRVSSWRVTCPGDRRNFPFLDGVLVAHHARMHLLLLDSKEFIVDSRALGTKEVIVFGGAIVFPSMMLAFRPGRCRRSLSSGAEEFRIRLLRRTDSILSRSQPPLMSSSCHVLGFPINNSRPSISWWRGRRDQGRTTSSIQGGGRIGWCRVRRRQEFSEGRHGCWKRSSPSRWTWAVAQKPFRPWRREIRARVLILRSQLLATMVVVAR
jgi:hypothetical protein